MKDRKEILLDLLSLKGDLRSIKSDLATFKWDNEQELVVLNPDGLLDVLKKGINGELDASIIIDWAETIELREDIAFSNEEISDIIFQLANPDINGPITEKKMLALANEVVGWIKA